ncbi:ankyrin repeat domain-containing protein [Pseudoduganella chitinolytica]|uniref:Ankyrin repeat domain-containing protein n=1 Tax=Pseudoduganella chitinolytica TaxID=34070 RepID=A0ABY8BAS2_9BURK|nr:ankyrin repeat domain-containing protein [Pseudoduganella chitinolytica]WEF32875.1 ankyrin repeat domain-containing protein [Pseudoduganella chitinolytica]
MNKLKDAYDAIKNFNNEVARHLLTEDTSLINAMTPFGTLLHVASAAGNIDIIHYLIAHGADINTRGGALGGSALNEAASDGRIEVVRYLLSHGAAMDTSEPERNPLFSSIYGGHVEVSRILISNGIDVTVRYTGESMKEMDALAYAVERGQKEIAALLSKH